MLAKFHGNILNLSENIAKKVLGRLPGTFFDSHCRINTVQPIEMLLAACNLSKKLLQQSSLITVRQLTAVQSVDVDSFIIT